jgi:glutamate synthase (NADPH/NADH) small chain
MPKFNMRPDKNPMPTQEPLVRNKNFDEVALGYSAEAAVDEAKRCLNCKNKPCVAGCPVNVNIPDFIACVAEGNFEEAYEVISETSSLPAVCGRVCPQETQCEGKCTRGIKGEAVAIGRLERFVADRHNANSKSAPKRVISNERKVAVVGSGPAGLACAGDLCRLGYEVTVFEALHVPGGVLVYGIPEFRLPKSIVEREIDGLRAAGVKFETNAVVGRLFSLEELKEDYGFDAIFLGTGAGLPRFMNIPGESARGVFSANEYLTRANLMKAYADGSETPFYPARRVAVIGGGNVAMDAARCAKRLGAEEVYVVYRRSEAELPARREEIEHAKEEEIVFKTLANPVEILADETGKACGLKCREMTLGEPDASGRRRPVEKAGSDFEFGVDCVILALGTSPNPLIPRTTEGLAVKPHGEIAADENGKTSVPGVFAGGDAVTGAATVILAMGAGKAAAKSIDEYIKSLH